MLAVIKGLETREGRKNALNEQLIIKGKRETYKGKVVYPPYTIEFGYEDLDKENRQKKKKDNETRMLYTKLRP